MRRDPDFEAAARALAGFDALGALRLVGLREDAGALALRGVAMAQLGEDRVAQGLLRRAERALRPDEPMHARVLAACGEVALAVRDLALAGRLLQVAEASPLDAANRAFVRVVRARRSLLLGRVDEANELLVLELRGAPARVRVVRELLRAEVAARRLHVLEANAAVARARTIARASAHEGVPGLSDEVERVAADLAAPVARLVQRGATTDATLADIAALERDAGVVVDACRQEVRRARGTVSLARRPVLFALARALGEAAPGGCSRALLLERAFGARRTTEPLRARLRVEMGRLRRALQSLDLAIEATHEGFALRARQSSRTAAVVVVLPRTEGDASRLLALLRDGEAWSSSALALASGLGQRAVQRALAELGAGRKVQAHGAGRAQRWVARPGDGLSLTLMLNTRPSSR